MPLELLIGILIGILVGLPIGIYTERQRFWSASFHWAARISGRG